jgi:hypothetical protein
LLARLAGFLHERFDAFPVDGEGEDIRFGESIAAIAPIGL